MNYRIEGNFGGGKLWRFAMKSPKFFLLIAVATELALETGLKFAYNSPNFSPAKVSLYMVVARMINCIIIPFDGAIII